MRWNDLITVRLLGICLTTLFLVVGKSVGWAREVIDPHQLRDQNLFVSGLEPAWALNFWPEDQPFPARIDGAGPVEYIHVSEQQNISTAEKFSRFIFRARNLSGVQAGSQVEIKFDPEFQKLTVHRLDVIREGKRISQLHTALWRVIQREDSLADNIFSGDSTALCFVSDLRPGDILDYSYTLRGANPVFSGRWYDFLSIGWAEPVAHLIYRVLVPPGRKLFHKTIGRAPPLRFTEKILEDGMGELRWEGDDLSANFLEGDEPSWYCSFPVLQLSETDSWEEVADWGAALYTVNNPDPALDELARQLASRVPSKDQSPDVGGVVNAIVNFVQNEIRYQAFHNGVFAFQPVSPSQVARFRYGDCKDKSRLLVDLLSRNGIKAHAAFVSTKMGPLLNDFLPSPLAFDHVIVRINDVSAGSAWIDPTINDQGGFWNQRAINVSGFALELQRGVKDLSSVSPPLGAFARIHTTLKFSSSAVGDPVLMERREDYFGIEADGARARIAASNEMVWERVMLRDVWEDYPQAVSIGPIKVEDDRRANCFTIKTFYRIPDFWKTSKDGRTTYCDLYAHEISETLPRINAVQRRGPLELGRPREVRQTIIISLPEEWEVEPASHEVVLPELEYHSHVNPVGNSLTLEYSVKFHKPHAPEKRAAKLATALKEIREDLGFQLTKEYSPLVGALRSALRSVAEVANEATTNSQSAQ